MTNACNSPSFKVRIYANNSEKIIIFSKILLVKTLSFVKKSFKPSPFFVIQKKPNKENYAKSENNPERFGKYPKKPKIPSKPKKPKFAFPFLIPIPPLHVETTLCTPH